MAGRWIHALCAGLRALFRRERTDRELSDELAFHVAMQTQANMKAGMTACWLPAWRASRLDPSAVLRDE
jgi:hypothetical protein